MSFFNRAGAAFAALLFAYAPAPVPAQTEAPAAVAASNATTTVHYRERTVDGVRVGYREAGDPANPNVVLLHGFPSSSHQFRALIPQLSGSFHVIAPDYPGFGHSAAPSPARYAYTFDHLASTVDGLLDQLGVKRYAIYVQDYGAPVGFRLATRHPDRIAAIVSQNGNAYDEGLAPFWAQNIYPYWHARTAANETRVRALLTRATTTFQYRAGYRDPSVIGFDGIDSDQAGLDRPGNDAIQLALFYDYRNNPPRYPAWHAYLRRSHVPVLAVWGKNDPIFLPAGALAFKRDVPDAEIHLIDSGHFATEDRAAEIGGFMRDFLGRVLPHG